MQRRPKTRTAKEGSFCMWLQQLLEESYWLSRPDSQDFLLLDFQSKAPVLGWTIMWVCKIQRVPISICTIPMCGGTLGVLHRHKRYEGSAHVNRWVSPLIAIANDIIRSCIDIENHVDFGAYHKVLLPLGGSWFWKSPSPFFFNAAR